jgi:hypothetical protein
MVVSDTATDLAVEVVHSIERHLCFKLFHLSHELVEIKSLNVEDRCKLKVWLYVGKEGYHVVVECASGSVRIFY